jgi:hypothetical protein
MGEVERQAIFSDAKWCDGYYDLSDPPLAGTDTDRTTGLAKV